MTESERPGGARDTESSGRADPGRSTASGQAAHYPDPEIDNPDEPRCPVCGGAIDRTDVICPHCGESLVAG